MKQSISVTLEESNIAFVRSQSKNISAFFDTVLQHYKKYILQKEM